MSKFKSKKLLRLLATATLSCVAGAAVIGVTACDSCGDDAGHEHQYETSWQDDETHHWRNPLCDDIASKEENETYGQHVDSNHDDKCDVCQRDLSEDPDTPPADETEYDHDETHHWEKVPEGETVADEDKEEHYDEDEDGKCDVCDADMPEEGPEEDLGDDVTGATAHTRADVVNYGKAILDLTTSTVADGTELDELDDDSGAGYYVAPDGTETDGTIKYGKDGSDVTLAQQTGATSNFHTVINVGEYRNSVVGYVDMKLSATGSKYGFFRLIDTDGNEIVRITSGGNGGSDGSKLYLSFDKGQNDFHEIEGVSLSTSYYNIYFKLDADGKLTLELNGKVLLLNKPTEADALASVRLSSGSSGARVVTAKNIIVATEATFADKVEDALAELKEVYEGYNEADYDEDDWADLEKAYEDAVEALEALKEDDTATEADIAEICEDAAAAMADIPTLLDKAEAELAQAQDEACQAIDAAVATALGDVEPSATVQAEIDARVAAGKKNVNDVELDLTEDDLVDALQAALAAVASEKTAAISNLQSYIGAYLASLNAPDSYTVEITGVENDAEYDLNSHGEKEITVDAVLKNKGYALEAEDYDGWTITYVLVKTGDDAPIEPDEEGGSTWTLTEGEYTLTVTATNDDLSLEDDVTAEITFKVVDNRTYAEKHGYVLAIDQVDNELPYGEPLTLGEEAAKLNQNDTSVTDLSGWTITYVLYDSEDEEVDPDDDEGYTWSNLPVGTYKLVATAKNNADNGEVVSAPYTIEVKEAARTTGTKTIEVDFAETSSLPEGFTGQGGSRDEQNKVMVWKLDGGASLTANNVSFAVKAGKVTVIVKYVNGSAGRYIDIFKNDGNDKMAVVGTTVEYPTTTSGAENVKEATVVFYAPADGTYYLGSHNSGIHVTYIKVVNEYYTDEGPAMTADDIQLKVVGLNTEYTLVNESVSVTLPTSSSTVLTTENATLGYESYNYALYKGDTPVENITSLDNDYRIKVEADNTDTYYIALTVVAPKDLTINPDPIVKSLTSKTENTVALTGSDFEVLAAGQSLDDEVWEITYTLTVAGDKGTVQGDKLNWTLTEGSYTLSISATRNSTNTTINGSATINVLPYSEPIDQKLNASSGDLSNKTYGEDDDETYPLFTFNPGGSYSVLDLQYTAKCSDNREFTKILMASGGRTWTLTAKSVPIWITVYYTISNGDFKGDSATISKDGRLQWTIGDNDPVTDETQGQPLSKSSGTVYKVTFKLNASQSVKLEATSNRPLIYEIIASNTDPNA